MENQQLLAQAKTDYEIIRKAGIAITPTSTVILGALFGEVEKLTEGQRLARKEADENKYAIKQLHALIVGDEPFHSWQRIYQTYEQKRMDRGIILGALDALAAALAEHNHTWTEGEREIYEQAQTLLGNKPPETGEGEAWKSTE